MSFVRSKESYGLSGVGMEIEDGVSIDSRIGKVKDKKPGEKDTWFVEYKINNGKSNTLGPFKSRDEALKADLGIPRMLEQEMFGGC